VNGIWAAQLRPLPSCQVESKQISRFRLPSDETGSTPLVALFSAFVSVWCSPLQPGLCASTPLHRRDEAYDEPGRGCSFAEDTAARLFPLVLGAVRGAYTVTPSCPVRNPTGCESQTPITSAGQRCLPKTPPERYRSPKVAESLIVVFETARALMVQTTLHRNTPSPTLWEARNINLNLK